MKNLIAATVFSFGFLFVGNASASPDYGDSIPFFFSGDGEASAIMAANRTGRQLCRDAGYRFADVEIVSLHGGIPGGHYPGVPWEGYAIATCFNP